MIPVQKNPVEVFELLFFAVFGQTSTEQLQTKAHRQSKWTEVLFKIVFGVYMLVSVVVLINLLIAMMTDTYQNIQVTCLHAIYMHGGMKTNTPVLLDWSVLDRNLDD